MNTKYKLTDDTITENGILLYRIEATSSFANVKTGDIGGYIEKLGNLNSYDKSWVYGNAKVYGDAIVSGDAKVTGNAKVYGNAWVYGNAKVYGDAIVYGSASVYGDARVYGSARVSINPILVNGLVYPILFCDKYITVGCQQHTKKSWLSFSDEDILKMDGKKALSFYPTLCSIIKSIKGV